MKYKDFSKIFVVVTGSVLILIPRDSVYPGSQNTNGVLVHLPRARPCGTLVPPVVLFSALECREGEDMLSNWQNPLLLFPGLESKSNYDKKD